MKKARKFLLLAALFVSCEDPITIELPTDENFIVVEGWVTDQPGPYRVNLSQTSPFNSDELGSKISNASVNILDSNGQRFELSEDPDSPGEYLSDSSSFRGTVGHRYTLEITFGDNLIVSSAELMRQVPPFDTLTYSFVQGVFVPETLSFTSGYLITGFVSDPATPNDYYRWKVTENDLVYDRAEDLVIITDRFFNGKRFGFELGSILFQAGDSVTIEQYSLNQTAFDFLRNINIQAVGLGKATSTPPSIVRGNLKNLSDESEIILGYFGASSISSASAVIQPLQ